MIADKDPCNEESKDAVEKSCKRREPKSQAEGGLNSAGGENFPEAFKTEAGAFEKDEGEWNENDESEVAQGEPKTKAESGRIRRGRLLAVATEECTLRGL